MAIVVSLMNMKGGVGKTTLAFQLALSASPRWKTLLVDIDPQANLSQSLMGYKGYAEFLELNPPSVVEILEGFTPPRRWREAPGPTFTRQSLQEVRTKLGNPVHLIPSRLELARTLKKKTINEQNLAKAIGELEADFDLVLIDCPPTESILTDAAYWSSRYILVPVKAEFLATVGFPLLKESLNDFKRTNREHAVEVVGVVLIRSGYRESRENRDAWEEIERRCREYQWHLFETRVPFSATFPRSARVGTSLVSTPNVSYQTWRKFQAFAGEFFSAINLG